MRDKAGKSAKAASKKAEPKGPKKSKDSRAALRTVAPVVTRPSPRNEADASRSGPPPRRLRALRPGSGPGPAVTPPAPRRPNPQPTGRRPLLLNRSHLRRRGWTESGILRFLGDPDAEAPNPVFPSAAHMVLYAEERVTRIEATDAWQRWREESERRRQAIRERAEERARERADALAKYSELASHAATR